MIATEGAIKKSETVAKTKLKDVHHFIIRRPIDAHCHFRTDGMAEVTLQELNRYYQIAIGMPNIKGRPIAKAEDVLWYRARMMAICSRLGLKVNLQYMMMLQDETAYQEVEALNNLFGCVVAFKCYLKGTTTNSDEGVGNLFSRHFGGVFQMMSDWKIPLSIHLEEPGEHNFFAEERALWRLEKLHELYPKLKIVMEHISTAKGIKLVSEMPDNIVGTLAIQHALLTGLDVSGNPHLWCKPMMKTALDREEIIRAALSGNPKFIS